MVQSNGSLSLSFIIQKFKLRFKPKIHVVGFRNRGDFRVVGDGREGLRVSLTIRQKFKLRFKL